MLTADVITFVEHGGIAGLCIVLWWFERADRKAISKRLDQVEGKLEKCLRDRIRRDQ